MGKVLVSLNVPTIEKQYNLWIPTNRKIYHVIKLMMQGINELNDGYYTPNAFPVLYNKVTGKKYNMDITVKDANIKNGMEIILI